MLNRIAHFIAQHRLLDKDKLHIVAVSGGADSVCLLLALLRLGYRVEAAHCNFHLRGEESQRDEDFVVSLCNKNNIKLHLVHFDTTTYAQLHHVSIEMAARELRYGYFEQLRNDIGAEDVCVAHHQDDSAETILMNLMRGTGLRGLTGICPRNGHIVRPLLCTNRHDIEAWLEAQGTGYVTDSSNLHDDIMRNFLRLNFIPRIKNLQPGVVDNILKTGRLAAEALRVYETATREAIGRLLTGDSIDIDSLLREPSPESILFEWLSPLGFSSATIEQIGQRLRDARSGNVWKSATHMLYVHQNRLMAERISPARPTLTIPEEGNYRYDEATRFKVNTSDNVVIERQPQTATLDAAKLSFPLHIRPVKTGDRFQPLGMRGTRLVSDFLTDLHLSIAEKQRQLVVTDATDAIVWLVGLRPDHRFRITLSTRHVVQIQAVSTSPS